MMRETYAALLPLVQEIALQLTKNTKSEWTLRKAEVDETMYFHIDSGDASLYITTEYSRPAERITISGSTPLNPKTRQYVRAYENVDTGNGMRWEEVTFSSISVTTKKSAETIAKDIISRFLPDYLKAVRLVKERIAADEKYATDKRMNLQACANTLNETLRSDYRTVYGCDNVYEPLNSFRSNIGDNIRVEVKANATEVDLKIDNLAVAQAQQVLALVKTFAK